MTITAWADEIGTATEAALLVSPSRIARPTESDPDSRFASIAAHVNPGIVLTEHEREW